MNLSNLFKNKIKSFESERIQQLVTEFTVPHSNDDLTSDVEINLEIIRVCVKNNQLFEGRVGRVISASSDRNFVTVDVDKFGLHIFHESKLNISASAKTDRMLSQLRAKHPEAQTDVEALIYAVNNLRVRQDYDDVEINRLDQENDQEEEDINRLEQELINIKRRRMQEMQTDINRFNIDRPMLPSGQAKVQYARNHNLYENEPTFTVRGWTYEPELLQEPDVEKIFHTAIAPDGSRHALDYTPYQYMDEKTFSVWLKLGRPGRVGRGPLDKKQLLQMVSQHLQEKKDACYNKVRSRYKVWPSAYASGALVQCRKKGAANWGNKS
jgi:hypothetical protein